MKRRDRIKRLHALYAQVPKVACKGLCDDACGPIDPGELERELMEERAGKALTSRFPRGAAMRGEIPAGTRCSMLSPAGRCTIYGTRPMICRVWGAVESMPCHHGCEVIDGQRLTDAEAYRLISEALEMPEAQVRQVVERVASGDLDEYLAALKPKTIIEIRRAALGEIPRGGR